MSGRETIHVRGEGGLVVAMDLPLPEPIADRLAAGQLVRVNPDGAPYTAGAAPAPARATAPAGGSALTEGAVPRPAKAAPKSAWALWAQAVHGLTEEQAQERTKVELMELPEKPAPASDGPQGQAAAPSVPAPDGRPDEDAPKSEWINFAFRKGKGSLEDLEVFSKDDLIEMTA